MSERDVIPMPENMRPVDPRKYDSDGDEQQFKEACLRAWMEMNSSQKCPMPVNPAAGDTSFSYENWRIDNSIIGNHELNEPHDKQ